MQGIPASVTLGTDRRAVFRAGIDLASMPAGSRNLRPSGDVSLFAQQRCAGVTVGRRARGVGPAVLHQLGLASPAADDSDVAEVAAAVGLEGVDLGLVVGGDGPLPVQPESP